MKICMKRPAQKAATLSRPQDPTTKLSHVIVSAAK